MNPDLDLDPLLYGVILVVLGVVAHRIAPEFGVAPLVTGVAGGAAMAFWGVLRLRGNRQRIGPIGTLLIVDGALLVLAVKAWMAIQGGPAGFTRVAVLLTVLLVFGVGTLVHLLREGKGRE